MQGRGSEGRTGGATWLRRSQLGWGGPWRGGQWHDSLCWGIEDSQTKWKKD